MVFTLKKAQLLGRAVLFSLVFEPEPGLALAPDPTRCDDSNPFPWQQPQQDIYRSGRVASANPFASGVIRPLNSSQTLRQPDPGAILGDAGKQGKKFYETKFTLAMLIF